MYFYNALNPPLIYIKYRPSGYTPKTPKNPPKRGPKPWFSGVGDPKNSDFDHHFWGTVKNDTFLERFWLQFLKTRKKPLFFEKPEKTEILDEENRTYLESQGPLNIIVQKVQNGQNWTSFENAKRLAGGWKNSSESPFSEFVIFAFFLGNSVYQIHFLPYSRNGDPFLGPPFWPLFSGVAKTAKTGYN